MSDTEPATQKKMEIVYPAFARDRGVLYWLRPGNLWASRRKFSRADHSNRWRHSFTTNLSVPPNRSVPFAKLLKPPSKKFRFLILGDTGEGDRSQYGLLPLIRELDPDFMLFDGDIAYPAGREEDFMHGFFRPYQGLGIPIWAVPGNHEYYSRNHGKEFFEMFCTNKWAGVWASHGLRLVPQPGTYWELSDPNWDAAHPDRGTPLVVLGLDSGKKGNLDGKVPSWKFWDRKKADDQIQHTWLEGRLRAAEAQGRKVIILFHIPALHDRRHNDKIHLKTLHQTIGRYACVILVVCGHEHNYQQYSSAAFKKYLAEVHGTHPNRAPVYVVSGGGGAYLGATRFKSKDYDTDALYPDEKQWDDYVAAGRKIIDRMGLTKWIVGSLASRVSNSVRSDTDASELLSMLMVDVDGEDIKVHPVCMKNLKELYPDHVTSVHVMDPHTKLRANFRNLTIRKPIVV